jgi:hypothetical protein
VNFPFTFPAYAATLFVCLAVASSLKSLRLRVMLVAVGTLFHIIINIIEPSMGLRVF